MKTAEVFSFESFPLCTVSHVSQAAALTPMVGRRVSKAPTLPPDLIFKNCCYKQFCMNQVSAKMANHKRSTDKQRNFFFP